MSAEPSVIDGQDTMDAALEAIRRGWHVHPLDHPAHERCLSPLSPFHDPATCEDRGKHPTTRWKERATVAEGTVRADFGRGPRNIGIATGPSGLLVVDEDRPGGLAAYALRLGQAIPDTYRVLTGRGTHFYFAMPPGEYLGGSSGALKAEAGCDVRGAGGFVVGAGSIHATGVVYEAADPLAPVAALPAWIREAIGTRSRQQSGDEPDLSPRHAREFGGLEHYLANAQPDLILGPRDGDGGQRHGAIISVAGSLRKENCPIVEAERFIAEVIWPRCEQPLGSLLPLEEALGKVRDVYARYAPDPSPRPALADVLTLPTLSAVASDPHSPAGATLPAAGDTTLPTVGGASGNVPTDSGDALPGTWLSVDLAAYASGDYTPPRPTLMPRNDGLCLLYPGLVHSVHGESESGKSWVMQAETARALKAGLGCAYIDFESDAGSVVSRLLDLGCTAEQIVKHLDYRQPQTSPAAAAELEAWTDMMSRTYAVATIDGVTDSLGVFGASSNDADEVARWMRTFPRQLAARTGAAVVLIDHVTKNAESRGRFASGSQAKMAGLTGAAYTVDVVDPLGRGLRGLLALRVAKDRPGGIRGMAGEMRRGDRTQEVAHFVLDSTGDHLTATLEVPDGSRRLFRPTVLMERVSAFVEANPGATQRIILQSVQGKTEHLRSAITLLIADGFIGVQEQKRSILHTSIKPYTEASDPYRAPVSPRFPSVPGEVFPVSPPLKGGERGTAPENGRTIPDLELSCVTCGQPCSHQFPVEIDGVTATVPIHGGCPPPDHLVAS